MRDDRGATLFLVTASLLFILGLAAIVVDGGRGFGERRQAQSAADFAVLAALQFARSCDGTTCDLQEAADNGAAEAMEVVDGNLPGRYAIADWSGCVDAARPARFDTDPPDRGYVATSTDCIAFTENFDEARVVLPDDTVETTFARVVGFDSLTVGAFAEAGQSISQSAVILPLNPSGGSPEACLFTNQTAQLVEPCNDSDEGSFGYIDLALYGNDALGTPPTCANGNQNAKISVNMSKGSDHILTTYSTGDIVVGDHDACPNQSEDINEVIFEPGAPTAGVTEGLIDPLSVNIQGNDITGAARIACHTGECANVTGRSLDHRPLWDYLVGACAGTSDQAAMANCLDSWSSGVIFSETISQNRRFAAVPSLVASPTGGPKDNLIVEFVPIWLESIYMACSGGSDCDTVHSPGGSSAGPCTAPLTTSDTNCGWDETGSSSVEQVTAFRLRLGMLPDSIAYSFPGVGVRRQTSLSR